jgi:Protein of unknown function (DUF5672)
MNYKFALIILLLIVLFIMNNVNYELFKNNEKYTAIIVEPREHKALEYVLNNFIDNLSEEWSIILFHGNKNIDFVTNIINKMPSEKSKRITLNNLKVDNLTIDEYSKLFATRSFYDNIPTEIFLVFQTDTVVCNKDLLNDYLEYDYVGAPWPWSKPDMANIGNGGLSLRHKTKMLEIIDKVEFDNINEDLYFAKGCKQLNCKLPDLEKQKKFSNESMLTDDSFGVHKLWVYYNDDELSKRYQTCPGIKEVKALQ